MRRQLKEFANRSPAEDRILAEAGDPEAIAFRKEEPHEVSAEFLRFMILSGRGELPKPVHESGLRIQGAFIRGVLDLSGCDIKRDLVLRECRLDDAIHLHATSMKSLNLSRSSLSGISAEHLTGLTVALWNATSRGEINFSGARLKGSFICSGASLDRGDMIDSLNLSHAIIDETLNLAMRDKPNGAVNLAGARVDILVDNPATWPDQGSLFLDGFRCRTFLNEDPVSRIEWLKLQAKAFFAYEFPASSLGALRDRALFYGAR